MTLSRVTATGAGVLLFALPFLQSGFGPAHEHDAGASAHMDHRPHHGGSLVMIGNHHLEVVERGEELEVHVSDAVRRPLRPSSATVAFDGNTEQAFAMSGARLVVRKPAEYAWAEFRIDVGEAAPLTIRLPAGGVTMPGSG